MPDSTHFTLQKAPQKIDMFYPLKVWALEIFLFAPLSVIIVSIAEDPAYLLSADCWQMVILFTAFGMGLSLPTLAATYISFAICKRLRLSFTKTRLICWIISLVGMFSTFWVINGSTVLQLILLYGTTTSLSYLFVKLKMVTDEFEETIGSTEPL